MKPPEFPFLLKSLRPLLLLPFLVACAVVPPRDAPRDAPRGATRCALVLGIDGLRPDELLAAPTPALDGLMARGSFAHATNAGEPWNGHSATNWCVLLTGVGPATSGVTENGDTEHSVGDDGAPGRTPTLFGHARALDPGIRTAACFTWSGIGMDAGTLLARSGGVLDTWTRPGSRLWGNAEPAPLPERDRETTEAAVAALLDGAELVYVHLDQVDGAGHAHTYSDPAYREAITAVDALVGRVLDALERRAGRANEEWLVVLAADHGGPADGTGHADNGDPEVRTIPFVLAADGVAPGRDLGSPRLLDVTPTVLDWLAGPASRGPRLEGRSVLPR